MFYPHRAPISTLGRTKALESVISREATKILVDRTFGTNNTHAALGHSHDTHDAAPKNSITSLSVAPKLSGNRRLAKMHAVFE